MDADANRLRNWPWGAIFGFSTVVLYVSLTIAAIIQFPGTVTPQDIYLSQLGNADVSPNGAIFYNLAVILCGLALILFYLALSKHFSHENHRWLWRIAILAGVINGLSVLMSGVFAEHVSMDIHTAWSYLIFLSLIPLLLAFSIIFWGISNVPKGISVYGAMVCAIDIVFLLIILSGGLDAGLASVMEWFVVFSYLVLILLVSFFLLGQWRLEYET